MTLRSKQRVNLQNTCDELVNARTISRLSDVPVTRREIGGDGAQNCPATQRNAAQTFAEEHTRVARALAYFITLSVKIAIDFTPPERLKSIASMAAA
jgi:hypothetical protein